MSDPAEHRTGVLATVLAALHGESFAQGGPEPWQAGAFPSLLGLPEVVLLVLSAQARAGSGAAGPCGFAMGRTAAGEGEILTLCVIPALRRQGGGRALCRALLAAFTGNGVTRVSLEVAADNPAALALYHGLGFQPAGRRPAYYRRATAGVAAGSVAGDAVGDGPVDALVMARALSPQTVSEEAAAPAGLRIERVSTQTGSNTGS